MPVGVCVSRKLPGQKDGNPDQNKTREEGNATLYTPPSRAESKGRCCGLRGSTALDWNSLRAKRDTRVTAAERGGYDSGVGDARDLG